MAVRLDASGDSLLYDGGAPSGDFTAMLWFRAVGDRNDYGCLAWLGADTADYSASNSLFWNQSGSTSRLELFAHTTTTPTITGSTTLNVGQWYHVAWVGSTEHEQAHSLYLDGVSEGSGTAGVGSTYDPGRIMLGNSPDDFWLDGRLAHWKLYNAQLTADEIRSEMHTIRQRRTTSRWQIAPLWGADDLVDYATNGRHFTGSGLATADGPPVGWGAPRRRFLAAAGGGTLFTQSLTGSLGLSGGTVLKQPGLFRTGDLILISGDASGTGAISKQPRVGRTGGLSLAGSNVRGHGATFAGSLPVIGTLSKRTQRALAVALGLSGQLAPLTPGKSAPPLRRPYRGLLGR